MAKKVLCINDWASHGLEKGKIYTVKDEFNDGEMVTLEEVLGTFAKDRFEDVPQKSSCSIDPLFAKTAPLDKHYNFGYTHKLSEEEKNAGEVVINIDPYFVSNQWQLGTKDNTGIVFHCLKTLARFGDKNSKEREIKALFLQVKRLAELEGVTLEN